jgi:hypothetical protein
LAKNADIEAAACTGQQAWVKNNQKAIEEVIMATSNLSRENALIIRSSQWQGRHPSKKGSQEQNLQTQSILIQLLHAISSVRKQTVAVERPTPKEAS